MICSALALYKFVYLKSEVQYRKFVYSLPIMGSLAFSFAWNVQYLTHDLSRVARTVDVAGNAALHMSSHRHNP